MRTLWLSIFVVAVIAVAMGPASAHGVVLQHDEQSLDVLLWQRMLNRWGGGAGIAEDGIFGPETSRATRRFERDVGLRPDGVVRAEERREWIEANITCCGAKKPIIYPGDYGPLVGHAQLELNKWLHKNDLPRLTINLLYGSATETAVRRYQAAHGLMVDGILGPQTWGEFFGWPRN